MPNFMDFEPEPPLCQGCIDADNERERKLTFG
jgi:hypothetical protein